MKNIIFQKVAKLINFCKNCMKFNQNCLIFIKFLCFFVFFALLLNFKVLKGPAGLANCILSFCGNRYVERISSDRLKEHKKVF